MRRVGLVALDIVSTTDWKARRGRLHPSVVTTTSGLLLKALKTYRSIELLCSHGLAEDAAVLNRSLFEVVLPILFILQKDSERRSAMHHAYTMSAVVTMIEKWRTTHGLKRLVTPKTLTAIRALRDVWSRRAGLPLGTRVKHWSGTPGLEQAAALVRGGAHWYQLVYRTTSPFAHGSALGEYFHVSDDEMPLKLGTSSVGIAGQIAIAESLLWIASSRVNERLKLRFDEKLQAVRPRNVKPTRRTTK